jgi:hypothetical protein
MKNIRDIFIILTLPAILLCAGCWMLENHYRNQLDKMGLLPKNRANLYPFGRRMSGYTVSENVPNYLYNVFDDSLKQVASEPTDSNGFRTDGTILRKEKDKNTIRIFITGGSAAWGSLESREIMKDTTYPAGCYCYKSSIAGKLKALLKTKYPQFNFEVINAAVVRFSFHQSFALYYEKIHDFNPDIIINMDGYNEASLTENDERGDPYLSSADQTKEELQLATMAMLPQSPYTLAYYNFNCIRHYQFNAVNKNEGQPQPISHDHTVINHEPSYKSCQAIRNFQKQNLSKKMLWLIRSYEKQLNADGVYSVFCLQPMLKRKGDQKDLSPTEERFRKYLEKKVTVADTVNAYPLMNQAIKKHPEYQSLANELGVDKYWSAIIASAYFFNDYSTVLDSLVTANGGAYIDINKAMKGMASDKEFYVDYCHLTPYGSSFVAEQLAGKVSTFMKNRFNN